MRQPIVLSNLFRSFCDFGRQNLFYEKASPFQDFVIPALDQETYGKLLQCGPGLGVFTLERFSCTEEDSRVSVSNVRVKKEVLFEDSVTQESMECASRNQESSRNKSNNVSIQEKTEASRCSTRKRKRNKVEGNLKPNQCTASALSVFEPTNQKIYTSYLWTCPGCGHHSERLQDFMQRPSVCRVSIIQTRQQSAQSSKTQVHERSSSCSSDSSDFEKEIEELKERVEGNLKPNQCTASALSVFESTNQKNYTSQLWTCPGCGHHSERLQDFMQRPSVEGNLKPNQCTASALSVFEPTNQKNYTSYLWTCPGCGHHSERLQDFMQKPSFWGEM